MTISTLFEKHRPHLVDWLIDHRVWLRTFKNRSQRTFAIVGFAFKIILASTQNTNGLLIRLPIGRNVVYIELKQVFGWRRKQSLNCRMMMHTYYCYIDKFYWERVPEIRNLTERYFLGQVSRSDSWHIISDNVRHQSRLVVHRQIFLCSISLSTWVDRLSTSYSSVNF